jgi:hypothetical protein
LDGTVPSTIEQLTALNYLLVVGWRVLAPCCKWLTRDWALLSQAFVRQSIDWLNTAIVSVIFNLVRRKQPRPITTSTERANHSQLQISTDTNCLVSPTNDRCARVVLTLFAELFDETGKLLM